MQKNISRREFVKTSAALSAATMLSGGSGVFAAGSDKIRVGLIGCGQRGTGAAWDCAQSAPNVQIYALADVFQDKIKYTLNKFTKSDPSEASEYLGGRLKDEQMDISPERCFVGFEAYRKVLATDVDLVILAGPPHFRPRHLAAAVEAGKHVFMEKPAGVDPQGIRSVIKSSEIAQKKALAIVAGTQRRHQNHYIEIMKRVRAGDIGKIVAAQCYWLWGETDWHLNKRQPGWSDMEWQLRSWPYFTWLSGDHIVEQHVHNLDVINWALGSHPVQCIAMGGRQVRTGLEYGNIFDHFAVEYEYPDGVRVASMCSQIEGTTNRESERVVGTKGWVNTDAGNGSIEGQKPFIYDGTSPDPYIREHAALIESIRRAEPINEGRKVAESTLTAIMGRMSAYTGRAIKWDWVMNASKLDLSPEKYELGDLPVRPVAVPGKTRLV
ncbi:MAG TPA: Gfo/Idh/MocA family oxidoreductase [Planctomycetes bacterium]|nr:Gfo/Idh/MocA family oxidoreductase [Planctomycetota bacterium]HIJ71908.1 Gfo/Idh/MocA family oxidoreductase [Planctomycetota bacterium]